VAYPAPFVPRTEREFSIVERARAAARIAAEHAAQHDRDLTFPEEGLAALAESGYLALAVPTDLGGEGAMIAEMVLGNLELAKGDASLGLVVAMHGVLIGKARDARQWPAALFGRLARSVVEARGGRGALVNSLATEPEMGSPSRGGMPRTRAERVSDGWQIRGRKSFSTGSPVLAWAVVSAAAAVDGAAEPRLASFLVPLQAPGVRIERSWDALGMRATGSDTVVFDDVRVPVDAEIVRGAVGAADGTVPLDVAWSLTVAAVYLGVAEAARDYAVTFARERRPTALGGKSIASVPHIRRRTGDIELQLYQARGLLVGAARAWDGDATVEARRGMEGALVAAKTTTADTAVRMAEAAMRLVGGSSLDRLQPLERHFRDVRGGLHHPPQEDAALELLARQALDT